MKKSHLIACFFLGILVFSTSLSVVMAADEWGVTEDSKSYYWLDSKEDKAILAQGMVTITVENIETATLDLTLTIETDFKGSQAIDFRDDIEVENAVYTSNYVTMAHIRDPLLSLFIYTMVTKDSLTSVGTFWDNIFDLVEAMIAANENLTISRDDSETSFMYKLTDTGTDEEWFCSVKYSTSGILQSLKTYHIDTEGVKTTLNFDKKLIPLNYPDLYFYIGGGVVVVVILVVLIACCARKKRR